MSIIFDSLGGLSFFKYYDCSNQDKVLLSDRIHSRKYGVPPKAWHNHLEHREDVYGIHWDLHQKRRGHYNLFLQECIHHCKRRLLRQESVDSQTPGAGKTKRGKKEIHPTVTLVFAKEPNYKVAEEVKRMLLKNILYL